MRPRGFSVTCSSPESLMAVPENDRLLRALWRQPTDRTPIWIMRQAGRYLPEYRKLRARAGSFLNLCRTPDYACEAALQPMRRYPLDAAIVFSDILTIPDAMGLGLGFSEGTGPYFERPVRSEADIKALGVPDPQQELRYVSEAVSLLSREIGSQVPVIGFAGSPWTLATYMIEGRGRSEFAHVTSLLQSAPEQLDHLLGILANSVALYLKAQIEAGAAVVMIFDSWGGILEGEDYVRFSLQPIERIMESLGSAVPRIVFARGGGERLTEVSATGCEAIGLDETVNLHAAREEVGQVCALQGNLDPAMLRADAEDLRAAARALLENYGPHPGHVFNLGHGITPDIDPDRLACLIDEVHRFSAASA